MKLCKYYKSSMNTLLFLCKWFYTLEDCGRGGPLHILLDDDNYEDNHIHFCRNACLEHPNSAVVVIGCMICDEYLKMSMEERAVFDAYLWNRDIKCKYDSCDECPLMLEVK